MRQHVGRWRPGHTAKYLQTRLAGKRASVCLRPYHSATGGRIRLPLKENTKNLTWNQTRARLDPKPTLGDVHDACRLLKIGRFAFPYQINWEALVRPIKTTCHMFLPSHQRYHSIRGYRLGIRFA